MTRITDQLLIAANTFLKEAIDDYCTDRYEDDPFRSHLGASILGHDCARFVFNNFRWMKAEKPSPRLKRLFNRGHEMEPRFLEWLKGAGFDVYQLDPNTGKQFTCSEVHGHFGGSCDGVAVATTRVRRELQPLVGIPLLCEFKTHNTKSFVHLVNNGVKISKPQHFTQHSLYGRAFKIELGLYLAINKNDDDIWPEFVRLDYRQAEDYIAKAEDIITARIPPPKIALNPEHIKCKFCTYRGICHEGEKPHHNCRACIHSQPALNAEWYCNKWQSLIPRDKIIEGCPQYQAHGGT